MFAKSVLRTSLLRYGIFRDIWSALSDSIDGSFSLEVAFLLFFFSYLSEFRIF